MCFVAADSWKSASTCVTHLRDYAYPKRCSSNGKVACGTRRTNHTVLELRMSFDVLLGAPHDVAFAAIAEFAGCFGEGNPESTLNFHAHGRRDVIDPAGFVAQEIKADDLENALLVSPRANVKVLDIRELGNKRGVDASLLPDLPDGGLVGLFTGIDEAFR